MLHLFNRTYLEHEVFYNTKYFSVIISSVEKPHLISEKLGVEYGKILSFQDMLQKEHNGNIDSFWSELLSTEPNKKKVIFADEVTFQERQIEFWKSIFQNPCLEFIYELYILQHTDTEIKLLMDIDRADNSKKLRPGQIPRLDFEAFKVLYDKTPIIPSLRNKNKDDLGFELLLANYFLSPNSLISTYFIQKLIRLTWRTWLSDVYSLRNDLLGAYYYLDPKLDVGQFLSSNSLARCFMDPNFNEMNSSYILKNYSASEFRDLYLYINPLHTDSKGNAWNNFLAFTDLLFKEQYFELLQDDIENRKGCTYLRNHLANESNQIMASMIYETQRLGNKSKLEKFLLA